MTYEQALEKLGLNPDIRLRQIFELGKLAAPAQEPIGSLHVDTLALIPTLRHSDGGAKLWPAHKAKYDNSYVLVYTAPIAAPVHKDDNSRQETAETRMDTGFAGGAQLAPVQPVGEVGTMPGTTGFTMACFKAEDVPIGTKLYTTAPTQPAPTVQEPIDLQFLKQVVGVAIAGLYEHYKEDVARVFDTSTLQDVAKETMHLGDQRVEDIYKHAWEMLATPPAQPAVPITPEQRTAIFANIPSEITCPFCESTHVPGWLHDMKCDAFGITEKGQP